MGLNNLSPQGGVAIGIIVGLLSTSIQSLGLTLQRKSHLLEDDKDPYEARRPPYKRRRWQLGMLMFVSSNLIGSTIQITTLPLPVLSTLQASGLVFNTAFATILLKEPFTRFSLLGTVLTCTGAALIAVFGAIGEPAHSLSQLLALLGRRKFVIWMAGTLVVVVATIVFTHFLKLYTARVHQKEHNAKHERSPSASRFDPNIRRSFTASLPPALQLRTAKLRLIRGLSYALISGILSAHSLLVAKSAVELLVRTIIDHNNQFNRYQSWLILLALLFFALSQLYYLHLGLRLCSTSVLYPFVFCVYNIIAILDGLIYFHQTSRLAVSHAVLIALGTVILLSGMVALSWRLDDITPADHERHESTIPPPNALTPGMGLAPRTSEDAIASSPLLPTSSRARASTSASKNSFDERTPLLFHHLPSRHMTLSLIPPAPDPGSKAEILAELDDRDLDDHDILGSLPRSFSNTLPRPRRRSRGSTSRSGARTAHSASQSRENFGIRKSRRSSDDSGQYKSPRRSRTVAGRSKIHNESRRRSAPGIVEGRATGLIGQSLDGEDVHEDAEQYDTGRHVSWKRPRSSSAAVNWGTTTVIPSRWDLSVSRWWQGTGKGKGKEVEEGQGDPGG